MEGRFVWWKTNLATSARIPVADPGLVADAALAAEEVEAPPGPARVLGHAAKGDLTPGRRGSRILGQRGSPVLNQQRSLVPTPTNLAVPPRAKSLALAQTLANLAPRAHPKSKPHSNPGVLPRRSRPVRSQEADQGPFQRVEARNLPHNPPHARGHPSPLPSAPPPALGLPLDPDQPPRIDGKIENDR